MLRVGRMTIGSDRPPPKLLDGARDNRHHLHRVNQSLRPIVCNMARAAFGGLQHEPCCITSKHFLPLQRDLFEIWVVCNMAHVATTTIPFACCHYHNIGDFAVTHCNIDDIAVAHRNVDGVVVAITGASRLP